MNHPLVSVIVTTKNNQVTLDACLRTATAQTYTNIELIVVDNSSTDDTVEIARRYTEHVFTYGPERSAQRNYAVQKSHGTYVLIIDSDMELGDRVVESCVAAVLAMPEAKAAIIPEQSFGVGFWAQCKALERSFYVGVDTIEAARFFAKDLYEQVGGYDETMTGGEDWDLTRRIRKITEVARADEFIMHNEGRLYFGRTARKMYYYAQHAAAYFTKNPTKSVVSDQSGPLERYKLFFSKPRKLFKNPVLGLGMLLLKTTEYMCAGFGLVQAKLTQNTKERA